MPRSGTHPERRVESKLRQRLWGATVLIAIAVIALPLLLDGAGTESQFRRVERLQEEPQPITSTESTSTVIVLPELRVVEEPLAPAEAIERVLSDSSSANSQAPSSAETNVESETREILQTSQSPLTAWVVQAASFTDEVAAVELRDQLRRAGFASFVRDRDANTDPFRVLVGPMIKQASAEKAKEAVTRLLNRDFQSINSNPEIMVYP